MTKYRLSSFYRDMTSDRTFEVPDNVPKNKVDWKLFDVLYKTANRLDDFNRKNNIRRRYPLDDIALVLFDESTDEEFNLEGFTKLAWNT